MMLMCTASAAYSESLTLYTSLEEEEIAVYVEAAKKEMPDIDINILRFLLHLLLRTLLRLTTIIISICV